MSFLNCKPDYTTISSSDIEASFKLHSNPLFQGYYYKGSDDSFHYFESKWRKKRNKAFKISRKHFTVHAPFSLNEKEITVSLIESNKKFGSTSDIILYVVI